MNGHAVHSLRPLRSPYNRQEQYAQAYAPTRDQLLSNTLGLGVSVYRRAPGHMALGYADVGQRNVNLSQPAYERVYALRTLGRAAINPRSAKAAYELAHEMGHVNRGNNEEAANAWAGNHLMLVLQKLGLGRQARHEVFRLARRQLLV